MTRRTLSLALLFILVFVSGCETVKGMCKGAFEGAKKDWENAQTADQRIREALW